MLDRTRDKLEEAQFFLEKWSESAYGTAQFRFFFSALVSAGRSVSWVLKKELRSLDSERFDAWWEEQRKTVLPAGLDFRTLADMRNEAVKEGALLPTSFRIDGFDTAAVDAPTARFFPGSGPGRKLQLTLQMNTEDDPDQPDLSQMPEELWDEALGRYAAGLLSKALEGIDPASLQLENQGLVILDSGPPVSADELCRLWEEYLRNLQGLVEAAIKEFA